MLTVESVHDALATAIAALATSPTRLGSDYRVDLEAIPAAGTRFQLRASQVVTDEAFNSNVTYDVGGYEITIHHRLVTPTNEAYARGTMLTDQNTLTDPVWWRAISGVNSIVDGPELVDEPARIGNVISYTVAAQVRVTP